MRHELQQQCLWLRADGGRSSAAAWPNLIHASDDLLENWIVSALATQGLPVDAKEEHSSSARGETGAIQRGGGRFVTLACASSIFHNVADRWPEAVDVSLLARYAKALADGALQLAQRQVRLDRLPRYCDSE